MKYDCDYYMNRYLSLDKGERLPYQLTLHIMKCPACQKEIKNFAHAEKIASEPLKLPVDADLDAVRKVVAQIDSGQKIKKHRVSIGSWIFFGIFLILTIFIGTSALKSKALLFVFYSSIAVAIVVYSSAFFAYNLDYFIKRFHMKIQN